MKFKTDRYGERSLDTRDCDNDLIRVVRHLDGLNTIQVNFEAAYMSHKKLRKFAKAILKETCK